MLFFFEQLMIIQLAKQFPAITKTKGSPLFKETSYDPILNQFSPFHNFAINFSNIYFNICLCFYSLVFQMVSSHRVVQSQVCFCSWFTHINNIWWREKFVANNYLIFYFPISLYLLCPDTVTVKLNLFARKYPAEVTVTLIW